MTNPFWHNVSLKCATYQNICSNLISGKHLAPPPFPGFFFKGDCVSTVVNLSISTKAGKTLLSNALLRNSLWSFRNDDAPWHYRVLLLECRRSKYLHRSPIHVPPLQYRLPVKRSIHIRWGSSQTYSYCPRLEIQYFYRREIMLSLSLSLARAAHSHIVPNDNVQLPLKMKYIK